MARKFLSGIDLNKQELRNARVQNLATAPSSPVAGQLYYDTDDNTLYWWNGGAWIAATGEAGSGGHTIRDNGSDETQRAALNFVSTTGIAFAATDDSGNDETEIRATPQFGAVTAQTSFGAASGNGSADTIARTDHTHGTPAHDAAAHSAISLSDLAAPTGDLDLESVKIVNLTDGTAATDAATLGQVQALVNVGTNKTAVRAASTANVDISQLNNGDALDGVTLATNDRVLLKNQSDPEFNGIYIVGATAGTSARATDADISAEVKAGLSVWVNEGTVNADTRWVLTTNDPITLDTTELTFTQDFAVSGTTAGAGLTAPGGNVLAVGQGTGIVVNANDVAIDPAVVSRGFVDTTVGDGSTNPIAITHSLGTRAVLVQIFDNSTFETVDADVVRTSTSVVTIDFGTAPANNAYTVVVAAVAGS